MTDIGSDERESMAQLDDDFLDKSIVKVKELWPGCIILRGSPRKSLSDGGIERVNLETQSRLSYWMSENDRKRWDAKWFHGISTQK